MARIATENKGIVRDTNSHALINTDRTAYEMYKAKREKDKKANEIAEDVQNLKQDMFEIKQMLYSLTRGSNG